MICILYWIEMPKKYDIVHNFIFITENVVLFLSKG